MRRLCFNWLSASALALLCAGLSLAQAQTDRVNLLRAPNSGLQPQAALDERGTLHLIYLTGEPSASDVFYVRREAGRNEFSTPLRVNSQPGSAIATGTIRGAQLALGKNGRV